jgi:hypothetical protein
MTLPDERYRAVLQTQRFLTELVAGTHPRVPKDVRRMASALLKHYPSGWDMQRAAQFAPDVFQERMEPLTRMFLQHKQFIEGEENDQKTN